MPKILLVTPPLLQVNTPYTSIPFLTGFLKNHGYDTIQVDLSIGLILKIFSKSGLIDIFSVVEQILEKKLSPNSKKIKNQKTFYIGTIDPVIQFLQNADSTLAYRISNENFLPRASRFEQVEDLEWAFGILGITDKARYLSSLYLDDLTDFIHDNIDPNFGFGKYAESIGISANSFDEIEIELHKPSGLIISWLCELIENQFIVSIPNIVGITVPFPGNLIGTLKIGQVIKEKYPGCKVVIGGGYVNTELRDIKDPRIFKYVDYICFDDGEIPLLQIVRFCEGKIAIDQLQRTCLLNNGKIEYINRGSDVCVSQNEIKNPDYEGLKLNKYLSLIEMANPMFRLWNDGRWNKMMLAYGCYWHKCSFCDITLDYIKRYDSANAGIIADRIESIINQTGQSGFHFVDEAAPPSLLRDLALELLRRKLTISWWGNIRFERNFTKDLCQLLAASGCVAVSGGIEVAHDRLLKIINKGVTIEQAAKACDNFTNAGIMVHTYLMYGFPTQTDQETIDSLEIVRQFFKNDLIQSGFWHLFVATAHSEIGTNPQKFNISIIPKEHTFALNDLTHIDQIGCNHKAYSNGLKKAIYNYMHGIALEKPVNQWFDCKTPITSIPGNYIHKILQQNWDSDHKKNDFNVIWIGMIPQILFNKTTKKEKIQERAKITFSGKKGDKEVFCSFEEAKWVQGLLPKLSVYNDNYIDLISISRDYYESVNKDFVILLKSSLWRALRDNGLVLIKLNKPTKV